jgi:hypothetical protein
MVTIKKRSPTQMAPQPRERKTKKKTRKKRTLQRQGKPKRRHHYAQPNCRTRHPRKNWLKSLPNNKK